MQSELKSSEHIKNYAYSVITVEGEKTVKSGITLNYHASKFVNFEVFRAMILEHGEPVVTCPLSLRSNARGEQGDGSYSDNPRTSGIKYPSRDAEFMIIRLSFSGIFRGEVPGRVPCYNPALHLRLSQIEASFQFGEWLQWVRQVVVLHAILAKLQNTVPSLTSAVESS